MSNRTRPGANSPAGRRPHPSPFNKPNRSASAPAQPAPPPPAEGPSPQNRTRPGANSPAERRPPPSPVGKPNRSAQPADPLDLFLNLLAGVDWLHRQREREAGELVCDPQGSPTRLHALRLLRQDLNVAWWRVFNALVGARAALAGRAPSRLARARLLELLAKETAEVYDLAKRLGFHVEVGPPADADEHTESCCFVHGCSFHNPVCTVTRAIKGQSVPCPEARACEAAGRLQHDAIQPRVTADAESVVNERCARRRAMFKSAVDGLQALDEALGSRREVEPVEVYDVGSDAFGLCFDCGAWPGERHNLLECEDCPRDIDDPDHPVEGAVFLGRWDEADLPALHVCQHEIHEAAQDPRRPRLRQALARLRRELVTLDAHTPDRHDEHFQGRVHDAG